MRGSKGITLVALIITIVVLLILAVVAITAITDNGIMNYAQNAGTAWNGAVANESETVNSYVNWLANATTTK